MTEVKKTLNFDECIAQGATILSAVVSPFMSVNSTKLKDYYPYKIVLTDNHADKSFAVVESGANYPSKKSITLTRDQDFILEARYDLQDSKFPIRDDLIATYEIGVK